MDGFVTQEMVIDALRSGELDPDSQIIMDIDGLGQSFKATAVTGAAGLNVISLFTDDNDWPAEVQDIEEAMTPAYSSDVYVAYCEVGEFYLFYEMTIEDTEGFGPNLVLHSDGAVYFDNGYCLQAR